MARDDSSAPSQEQPAYSPEGGRPKKPAAERRSERVTINLKPSEREAIEAKAEVAGLSMSGLMRQAALGRKIQMSLGKKERSKVREVGRSLQELASLLREHGWPSSTSSPERIANMIESVIAKLRNVLSNPDA